MFKSQIDWVYVALSKDGFVKVGWTDDPTRRVKAAFDGKEVDAYIVYLVPVKEGIGPEYKARIQGFLYDFHMEGSWYNCYSSDAIKAIHQARWIWDNDPKLGKEIDPDKKYSQMIKIVLDKVLSPPYN